MATMIDPPNGWKYGFPKPVHEDYHILSCFSMTQWLVSEGYPQTEIDKLGDNFFIRSWDEIDVV
tara:strand:- start:2642 stop:2833 length:192 start_codon:yes stop_codon:yes gene_type:complete